MLVVWAYNLDDIIPHCRDFEDKLIKLVWNHRSPAFSSLAPSADGSPTGSAQNLTENPMPSINEKEVAAIAKEKEQSGKRGDKDDRSKRRGCGIFGYFVSNKEDVEKSAEGPSSRPMRMFAPIYGGLAVALAICEHIVYSESYEC